jgi:hypothetical protein
MTSKFEQLIEYVINDEEEKAKALFHDIVVEKSREIYENLMNEDTMEEECHHCHGEGCDECMMEEGMEDTSGDSSQDLMREVETEEEGMMEEEDAEEEDVEFDDEAEKAGEEETHDAEHDHDIEDRVVDLEDKLDELMAEFETLMGDEHKEHGDEMMPNSDHVGGDAYMDDDTSEFHDETMSENVDLKRAPAPVTTEPSFVNKKANYAVDSGARGMQGKPVRNVASEANPDGTSAYKAPTSYADKGRGDLPDAGKFKNVPATAYKGDLDAAPKPKFDQHNPNTRTPFPKG